MTEAWLLIDEATIRRAAGNPNGRHRLSLSALARLETLSDPRATLRALLVEASSTRPRLRRTFDANEARQLVPERVDTFAPLRSLDGFARFEQDLERASNQIEGSG